MNKIPLFRPNLGQEELEALKEIFATGWVGLGPKVSEFEIALAAYQQRKSCVATNSCTAALHLALNAFNLPSHSEVLVPTITFVSTPHAVEYNGLNVRFVDVRSSDLCMDVADFQRKITASTKAVIPVHMGGQPCRMDEIVNIAAGYGMLVIEDVANAQGGEWKGKKLGSWGHMGTFSFEAKKNMTTGDGGAVVFDEHSMWEERIRQMRWVGIDKDTWKRFSNEDKHQPWYYEVNCLGYKYNMNDLAAAIGLCQLKKLDGINLRKRTLIDNYLHNLCGVGDLCFPSYDLETGGYWLFIVQTDRRDALLEFLGEKNIACGVHFMPTHLHPYYRKKYPDTSLPVAEHVWKRIVSLPLYASMTESDQAYVVDSVKEFFRLKV